MRATLRPEAQREQASEGLDDDGWLLGTLKGGSDRR